MLADILQRRTSWLTKSPNGKWGYIRLSKFIRWAFSPKSTVGDDGCHSRQWVALFYYGNYYIEATCLTLMKLVMRICKVLSPFSIHAAIKHQISHPTHLSCTNVIMYRRLITPKKIHSCHITFSSVQSCLVVISEQLYTA